MIPEIFHRIWFGNQSIPLEYERYWQAWQRQYPHYVFKTWHDNDIDNSFSLRERIVEAQGMARKADIARYEILLNDGGIYLDCDMMPYHFIDWQSLNSDFIVCNETESSDYCSIGMIASSKNNIILQTAVTGLLTKPINQLPPNIETGPYYFAQALQAGPFKRLPVAAFYPYLGDEPYSRILSRELGNTYGIHVWGGSWFDEAQVIEKLSGLIKYGDLAEVSTLGKKVNEPLQNSLSDFTNLTKQARLSLLAAANHPLFINSFNLSSTVEFDFLKCAFYLMEKEPTAHVWQIGAADGILVDPLRPLIISFDPHAYLLEPNPILFQQLKTNYCKNTQTSFLNVALGQTSGQLDLNAVDTELAKKAGLPDWVAGISSFYTDRNALGGLTIDAELTQKIQKCVKPVTVPMINTKQLLEITKQHPEIVVIDVEGMDAEIVKCILNEDIKPKIIQFEIQCLPQIEMSEITEQLEHHYIQLNIGNDRVCYRKDFFKEYCDHLYISYGIPTYYKNIFRDLVKCD